MARKKGGWKARRPKDGARMPLLEHLNELRHRLMVIVIAIIAAVCVLYFFAPQIILFLIQPVARWIAQEPITSTDQLSSVLNVLDPLGGFTLRFKVSLFAAVVVTSPIWIWQLMAFFLPALKPSERKWVIPTFCVAVALFIFGAVFCYAVILTTAFQWLLGQTSDFANVFANASDYVGLIMLFEVAFGAAFELPLVVFYLLIFNIIKYKKLRKSWRVVYIVLLVFCAVVTPDSSPVTMALMFVAMAALYEISLFAARIVLRKRIKNNQEASDGETGDGDEDDDD